MGESKKNSFAKKLEKIIVRTILCLALSIGIGFVLAVSCACLLETGNLSLEGINEAFGTDTFKSVFPITAAVAFLGCLLYILPNVKESKEMKGKDELENQRFMREDELDTIYKNWHYFDELHNATDVEGWPIHTKIKGNRMKIHFSKNYHFLVVGSTGSGKTETFVIPAIQILSELKTRPSMFITDTKGELYAQCAKKMQDDGYKVVLLNIAETYNSIQWNPLTSVYDNYQSAFTLKESIMVHVNDPISKYNFITVGPIDDAKWYEFQGKAFSNLEYALSEVEVERTKIIDECLADLDDIATALCPIAEGKDAMWDQGAKDYIYACLIAMLEDSANPKLGMTRDRFNFYNMYKLAMNKDNDMEDMVNYFKGRSPLSKTRQLINHILDSKAKQTRDSFLSTIASKISMFADNGVCFLTAKNDIDFFNFDEKPTVIFLKIPDERKTRYTLASVCITQSYKEFVRKARANEYTTGKASLKRPLYYVMDEFANLPPVQNLSTMITVSRSRRIYFGMVIQAYSQLKDTYGEATMNTVRTNCNGEVYLGTPDTATREEFSKKLGNYTIKVDSTNSGKGADGKNSDSTSTSFQSRPLVYPRDLVNMKKGQCYIDCFPDYPINSWIDAKYTAGSFYRLDKIETPFIPGRRLNEEALFYDPVERNKIVLGK